MSDSFYIQVRGKRQGPFTADRLRQMAKRGRFGRQHRVSTDGRNWKPAEEFPELFAAEGERKMRQSGMRAENPLAASAATPAAADPTSVAPTAPSSQGWFYSHDGQQLGPVSMEVLKHAKNTGTLNPDDLVWTHGMTEWKRADKALPGLFSAQAEAAPGPQGTGAAGPAGIAIEAHPEMHSMAIYSLLLSFIPLLGSVAAIVCGHKALSDIDSSHGQMEGRNMAIGGLVLGYGMLVVLLLGGLYYMSSSAFEPGSSGWTPQLMDQSGGQQGGAPQGGNRPGFTQPPNRAPAE